MKKSPLISVLLSAYNAEDYIEQAINSIIYQTYSNWELIIVDDGSTDQTPIILKKYTDQRIRIISHSNMGLTTSLNKAAFHAKGELLARQDADDISQKTRFELQVEQFLKNENIVLVSSDTAWIDCNNKILDIRYAPLDQFQAINKMTVLTNPFVHGSLMFKKSAFDAVSGYNENLSTSQDFELIIRLSALNKEFSAVPHILYFQRVHKNTVTTKKWMKQIHNTMKCAHLLNSYYPNAISIHARMAFIVKKMIIGGLSILDPQIVYTLRKLKSGNNQ